MGTVGARRDPDASASMPASPVETLQRWEESGATWRVVVGSSRQLTIALLRCDGGEEVDRLVSDDPELMAFVADRSAGSG